MFDDRKQRSLFDKFDSVVIDYTMSGNDSSFNIAGDDLKYCEKAQKEFDLIIENLRDFKALCESVREETGKLKKPDDFEIMSKGLMYFPGTDFDEKETEAKQSFIYHISLYFSKKYNLKEIDFNELLKQDDLNYKQILEKIFSEFGDILNCGVSNLISDFRSHFVKLAAFEPKPPKLSNNKITLHKYYWYDSNFDHTEFYFESNNEGYHIFRRAILYFETGDITAEKYFYFPKTGYRDFLDFSEPYELELEKIKAVKFFKNYRVDIIFNSTEYARQFFETFDMANPIDRSRRREIL